MSKVLTDQIEKRTGGTAMDVPTTGKWPTANIADDAIGTAQLSATGTADATTFLRGDNAWTEVVMGLTWEAVQTSAFTAVAGKAYPVNTTAAAITVTLPASPSAGDEVLFLDYAGTFDTNVVTLGNNGSNIMGNTSSVRQLTQEYQATTIRYIDATLGWTPIGVANGGDVSNPLYIEAVGPDSAAGNIDGNYKYHIFTASKTGSAAFNVTAMGNSLGSNTVEYLAIAGGGGGGGQHGGGGGAGGYLNATGWSLQSGVGYYDVTIGAGGAKSSSPSASNMPQGGDGTNTVWAGNQPGGITTTGGGGGGSYRQPAASPGVSDGRDGGSGGGGGSSDNGSGFSGVGGSATAGQGTAGGKGRYSGGGGGGAGVAGGQAEPEPWGPTNTSLGGAGGTGLANDITGPSIYRGGGGGGGAYNNTTGGGAAGNGGGAAGSSAGGHPGGTNAVDATANTGGGGGGGALGGTSSASNGGSGVVIIRYKFQN